MRIVLIGFMGSGKTTVGKILADTLRLKLIEADELVVERNPYDSISQIFTNLGEDKFRHLESEIAKSLVDQDEIVISTGGGAVMNEKTMDYLKTADSKTIFLHASFDSISDRLKGDSARPLFKDRNKAKELYNYRLPLYKKYADLIVETNTKEPKEIAKQIIKEINHDNL